MAQRVRVMGGLDADGPGFPTGWRSGPLKVMVADGPDPTWTAWLDRIDAAHRSGRPVALHCVSLVAAAVGAGRLGRGRRRPGDRMEHGAVLPPDVADRLAEPGGHRGDAAGVPRRPG